MMPKKAFLRSPELVSEFTIAARLGMTVARLRLEMSCEEFAQWIGFYAHEAWQREQQKG